MEGLEQSLEAGSGLAGMERAMLRHNPELLRSVMQGLVEQHPAPSPPGEAQGVEEGGTTHQPGTQ